MLTVNQLLDLEVNEQVKFDAVNLIGTDQFTVIGRPEITSAKVYATVMEQARAEKVIVFKMKRRKGYKKSYGHSHKLTNLKIDRIEYDITEEVLGRAVSLVN